jgi:hypothetical protein
MPRLGRGLQYLHSYRTQTRARSTVAAVMAKNRCWFPRIDLDQILTQFLCRPLRLEYEISESKIADLPSLQARAWP